MELQNELLGICLTAILPIRGKQRAHDEKAACPCWESSVPHFKPKSVIRPSM